MRPALVRGLCDARALSLRDAEGRPLGEVSAPGYDEVPTEVVACPYADGRRGQPMNVTALRQLTGAWPALLGTVRTLSGPSPTAHRAWRTAVACTAAPLLVAEPVPVPLAALFKTALGLSQVTTALLLAADGVADTPLAALGTPAEAFDTLDRDGWLQGQLQVCAGSRPMIEQMWRALGGASDEAPCDAFPWGDWLDEAAALVGLQVALLARPRAPSAAATPTASTPSPPPGGSSGRRRGCGRSRPSRTGRRCTRGGCSPRTASPSRSRRSSPAAPQRPGRSRPLRGARRLTEALSRRGRGSARSAPPAAPPRPPPRRPPPPCTARKASFSRASASWWLLRVIVGVKPRRYFCPPPWPGSNTRSPRSMASSMAR
ncbi:MAG: hypothetical protein R3F59_34185 [Myxococcota bacterium]